MASTPEDTIDRLHTRIRQQWEQLYPGASAQPPTIEVSCSGEGPSEAKLFNAGVYAHRRATEREGAEPEPLTVKVLGATSHEEALRSLSAFLDDLASGNITQLTNLLLETTMMNGA